MLAANPQFPSRVSIATGFSSLFDVAAADFNGDGKIDLAVDDYNGRKIVTYLNTGNGSFGTPVVTNLNLGGTTGSLTVGDINEDGKQDLIVGTISGGDQQNLILLGNGDGTFTQSGKMPGSYGVLQGRLVDINSDGHLDFLGADAGNVQSYLGDGKGGFTAVPLPNQGAGRLYFTLAAADVNRDSKIDFVAGSMNPGELRFYAGNSDGTFQSPVISDTLKSAPAYSMSAADFNGDGRPDIIFGVPTIALLAFGNGDGTFRSAPNQYVSPPVPTQSSSAFSQNAPAIGVADMDKDGTQDVVIVDPNTNTVNVDLNTNGQGDFARGSPDFSASVPANSSRIALVDLNGDGLPDIVTTSYSTNEISIFLSVAPKVTPKLSLSGTSATAFVGTATTISAKVAGAVVPTGTVSLYDGNSLLSTQTLDGSGQASFPPVNLAAGQHTLAVTYSGDTKYNPLPLSGGASVFVTQIVDVAISIPTPSQTIMSGSSASYIVSVTPTSNFTGSVALSCSGLPAGFSCPGVAVSGASAILTVTPPTTMAYSIGSSTSDRLRLAGILSGLCILPIARRRRYLMLTASLILCVIVPLGCSSSSSSTSLKRYTGTTSFSIVATITQGSSTATKSTSATLIVQ